LASGSTEPRVHPLSISRKRRRKLRMEFARSSGNTRQMSLGIQII
jgi:hypothetical protein